MSGSVSLIDGHIDEVPTCKLYAEFEGVCCNGYCKPYVADICPYDEQSECEYYESECD